MLDTGRVVAALLLSAGLLGTAPVQADQPRGPAWKVEGPVSGIALAGETPGGDSNVVVQLSNPFASLEKTEFRITAPMLLVFNGCNEDPKTAGKPIANLEDVLLKRAAPEYFSATPYDPAPMWRVCAKEAAVVVTPALGAQVSVSVDFLRIAAQGMIPRLRAAVHLVDAQTFKLTGGDANELAARYRGRPPGSQLAIDLYYRIVRNTAGGYDWKRGTYAQIFGDPGRDPANAKRGGTIDYAKSANVLPVSVDSYRRKLKTPGAARDDGGVLFKQTIAQVLAQGSSNAEDPCGPVSAQVAAVEAPVAALATVAYTISGRFSTRWSADHSLHPGFGFQVQLQGNRSIAGLPVFGTLGGGWVQADGRWTVNIPASVGYLGGSLTVLYHSYNTYYAPMNQSESRYSWGDPIWTLPAGTTAYNVGHRVADTDGGVYNGVGELVDAAMTMWSRLYWDAGINPVAATPIKFFFPNTWDDCGDGSGVPWSCASRDGMNIWLIASHGTQGDVVNHEMGHTLNTKFWGGKRPAGSGGSHSLNSCYPTRLGMTLREGFANFIAVWVGYPSRNGADGSFGSGRWGLSWDPEQRTSPPNCANGWENEGWVARTFWDLHDKHADGDDILWFVHPGAVIALYLNNGIAADGDARDMRFYENIYRNAASAGHQQFISDIFNQDRM